MSYPILFTTTEASRVAAIADIAIANLSVVDDDEGASGSIITPDQLDLTTLGKGVLSDAIDCEVVEKRNGSYEVEMRYPITGIHFDDIATRAFILAKPNYTDDPQLFRIYRITKPLNGICTIYAQHVSYDMSGYYIPGGLTAASLTAAVTLLNNYSSPFTISSTKTGTSTFSTDVPSSVRSWLGGKNGSFLDLYGGEWHFDNFTATLSTARGTNRGVTIRYGKNLTEFKHDADSSNLYTAVLAYYKDNDGNLTVGTAVSTGLTIDTDRVYLLDRSSAYQSDSAPTASDLTQDATDYIDANNLTIPAESIELDFVQLQGLAERVDLCDTVTIEWEEMGVSATAKCIETTWDVLKERYTKCKFGTARSTLADTVSGIITAANESLSYIRGNIANTQSALEEAIESATALISGNQGGYVVINDSDDDGYPDEILIMDDDDISQATKVWRWNSSGLGYSSEGYSGGQNGYSLAMTIDGRIVADFITTGNMSADRISGGTLTLGGSSNGNGVLEVYDASGNLVVSADNTGLYAVGATISGAITATSLTLSGCTVSTSDISGLASVATSGSYSDLSSTPDLTVYIAKDGTIGSTPSSSTTGFKVSSAGLLTCSNAVVYGTIYSSAGTIGGWTIGSSTISNTNTSSGWYIKLAVPTSLGTYGTSSADVLVVRNGTSSYSYPFVLSSNGHVHATDVDITGKITSTSGSIANWTITTDQIQFDSLGYSYATSSGNTQCCLRAPTASFSGNAGALVVQYCTGSNTWTQRACIYYDGTINGTTFNTISDRNVKSDISTLDTEKSEEFIYSLNPVSYRLNALPDVVRHGFIAQDVEESVYDSEWGIVGEDENDTKNLCYTEIIADLVATVQSLNARIKVLEAS